MKHLSLVPALVIAAQYNGNSISTLINAFRSEGLGGYRASRKLIYRLEHLGLFTICAGGREDRREKAVALSDEARALLSQLRAELQQSTF